MLSHRREYRSSSKVNWQISQSPNKKSPDYQMARSPDFFQILTLHHKTGTPRTTNFVIPPRCVNLGGIVKRGKSLFVIDPWRLSEILASLRNVRYCGKYDYVTSVAEKLPITTSVFFKNLLHYFWAVVCFSCLENIAPVS